MTRKQRIGRAFDQAAPSYDARAPVQKLAAERLAALIADEPAGRILEIGCGTGFLTAALAERWPRAMLVASDLSPAMVRTCGRRVPAAIGLTMDGERPCFSPESFDLVCASLAVQWFEDLPTSLAALCRLLRPGGRLAVSTLLSGSLIEWRQAHGQEGFEPATPDFAAPAELQHFSHEGAAMTLVEERIVQTYPDGLAFARALKAIGAGTPRANRPPLSVPALRRVARRFESSGPSATYHIGYGVLRRE